MVIVALILSSYAITLALVESSGPWGVIYRLRHNKHVEAFGLLDCTLCTSFWVSIALVLAFRPEYGLLGGLGVWGAVVVLGRAYQAILAR